MRRLFLMLPTALLLCAPASHAASVGAARRAVQAAYAAVDSAVAHKDAPGATAFYAPGYTSTDTQGRVTTAAQQRASAAQVFASARSVSSKTTVTAFSLDAPDKATATARAHVLIVLPPQAATGKPVTVALDVTERDRWVKTAAGWREASDRVLSQAMTANGKPLPKPS